MLPPTMSTNLYQFGAQNTYQNTNTIIKYLLQLGISNNVYKIFIRCLHHITNRKISKHLYVRSTMSKTLSQRFVTIGYLLQCLQNCQKSFHKISFLRMFIKLLQIVCMEFHTLQCLQMYRITLATNVIYILRCLDGYQKAMTSNPISCDVYKFKTKPLYQNSHSTMSMMLQNIYPKNSCLTIRTK